MATLASDWLGHSLQLLDGIWQNLTGNKYHCHLPSLCSSCWSINKYGCLGLWLRETFSTHLLQLVIPCKTLWKQFWKMKILSPSSSNFQVITIVWLLFSYVKKIMTSTSIFYLRTKIRKWWVFRVQIFHNCMMLLLSYMTLVQIFHICVMLLLSYMTLVQIFHICVVLLLSYIALAFCLKHCHIAIKPLGCCFDKCVVSFPKILVKCFNTTIQCQCGGVC